MQKSEAESVGLDQESSTARTTDPHPDSLQAGRELDALIAEKVMGFPVEHYPEDAYSIMRVPNTNWCAAETQDGKFRPTDFLPKYSSDISDAWLVVERIAPCDKNGFPAGDPSYSFSIAMDGSSGWWCGFNHVTRNDDWHTGQGATAPLAICEAALLWAESNS